MNIKKKQGLKITTNNRFPLKDSIKRNHWKKVKQKKKIKNNKKSSQGDEEPERKLWRPYNPWLLP